MRRERADFIRARRSTRPSLTGRIYDCICCLDVFFSREPLDIAGGSIYVSDQPRARGYRPPHGDNRTEVGSRFYFNPRRQRPPWRCRSGDWRWAAAIACLAMPLRYVPCRWWMGQRDDLLSPTRFSISPSHPNSSNSVLAFWRSAVSKPSVNQL